jgi:hypothetical protein
MRTVEEPTTTTSANERSPISIERSASPERARELPSTTVDPSRLMTMQRPIVGRLTGRLAGWLAALIEIRDRATPYASATEMVASGVGNMRRTAVEPIGRAIAV